MGFGILLSAVATLAATGQAQPTLSSADFIVGLQASLGVNLSANDAARFFNLARYQCDQPVYFFIGLQPSGNSKSAAVLASFGDTGQIAVWLGTDCASVVNQELGQCRQVAHEPLQTFLTQGSWTIVSDPRIASGFQGNTADPGTTFVQPLTVVIDYEGDGTADLSVNKSLFIDVEPPPAPAGATVTAGKQALVVQWNQIDTSLITDLAGYQVLCSRADQYEVFNERATDGGGAAGQFSAAFETCPDAHTAAAGVEALDPTFVCSPLLSPETTSYRIEVLQNGITYAASVVAVDKSGNPSTEPQVLFGTPDHTASDPGANTGFCSVSPAPARWGSTGPALTALGALIAAMGLRRRRTRWR
jgi:hypothetical protein